MLDRNAIAQRYRLVRAQTDAIAAPLSSEDMLIQSMPDASPTKWHLAHTTWFFEEFVLGRFVARHTWHDDPWRVLFNSYYESVGPSHSRPARGLLSRPTLAEVRAWRARVDEQMAEFLRHAEPAALDVAMLGTHHEQQHQELMLTDVKHAFFGNPMRPHYGPARERSSPAVADRPFGLAAPVLPSPAWLTFEERMALVGHDGEGFSFDNERPMHRSFVNSFRLASRLVTNGEYARFIQDNGYDRAELWLSAGFSERNAHGWVAPLYWERAEPAGDWEHVFTLHGVEPLDAQAPVAHLSFYEADAYARWAGARLPTEEEWEVAGAGSPVEGNFVETGRLAPANASGSAERPLQLFGDVWEWTASAYLPYPRFQPLRGALGEYNGKFMSGQMTLRGGSCLSPQSHLRLTYRNYFPPPTRWQMTGLRLAQDV